MPDQNHKKAKTININLTETEYEKVKQLAEIRDLNPTAYTRLAALGNRIKPTVVYANEEDTDELKKEKNELKDKLMEVDNKFEVLKEDYEQLKEQYNEVAVYVDTFKRFLQYVNADAEYINLSSYMKNQQLKTELRDAIRNLL